MLSPYRSTMTRRRSFRVGVSSPMPASSSTATPEGLDLLGSGEPGVGGVDGGLDLGEQQRVRGQAGQLRVADAMRPRPLGRDLVIQHDQRRDVRPPIADRDRLTDQRMCPKQPSMCAGEMFLPLEVMMSSFLRSVMVR